MKLSLIVFLFLVGYINAEIRAQGKIFIEDSKIARAQKEAILILPGFGSKVFGTKKIAKFFRNKGFDIYIPRYISRKSVQKSVENVDRFIEEHELKAYKKLHVFSYIFGTWAINSWINKHGKNNISTIVYDRSPLQERAPAALMNDSPILAKVLFGNVMRDFCNTPYESVNDTSIITGIFIENYATKLINKHKETVLKMGNINFSVENFNQPFDDYCFLPLNHDEMYKKLDVFGQEVLNFIHHHSFSQEIKSKKYQVNPFIKFRRK